MYWSLVVFYIPYFPFIFACSICLFSTVFPFIARTTNGYIFIILRTRLRIVCWISFDGVNGSVVAAVVVFVYFICLSHFDTHNSWFEAVFEWRKNHFQHRIYVKWRTYHAFHIRNDSMRKTLCSHSKSKYFPSIFCGFFFVAFSFVAAQAFPPKMRWTYSWIDTNAHLLSVIPSNRWHKKILLTHLHIRAHGWEITQQQF